MVLHQDLWVNPLLLLQERHLHIPTVHLLLLLTPQWNDLLRWLVHVYVQLTIHNGSSLCKGHHPTRCELPGVWSKKSSQKRVLWNKSSQPPHFSFLNNFSRNYTQSSTILDRIMLYFRLRIFGNGLSGLSARVSLFLPLHMLRYLITLWIQMEWIRIIGHLAYSNSHALLWYI